MHTILREIHPFKIRTPKQWLLYRSHSRNSVNEVDSLATIGCSIFYNTIIDPISRIFDAGSDGSRKSTDRHNCSTIPSRHCGRRASKSSHTRNLPFCRSYIQTFRKSTKPTLMPTPTPEPPDLIPTRWTYFANECLLAKECLFREFQSAIQECHTPI